MGTQLFDSLGVVGLMPKKHSSMDSVQLRVGATRPVSAALLELTEELTASHEAEVLSFLGERPIHTVIMSGLIHDNGINGPQNRGKFYAYRDPNGTIEGVALIGHATLVEARNENALAALARRASDSPGVDLILGEHETIERFWRWYSDSARVPQSRRSELLFEQRWPSSTARVVRGLRTATLDDLNLVVASHARMAEEELGVNPLTIDADGFRLRCQRRIEQGRVWVWIKNGRLVFKADVVAETGSANYIEGVYVDPAERSKGYGARCLAQVSRKLLARTQALCLLVNENNRVAQGLARKSGYTVTSCYESIFLRPPARASLSSTEPLARGR
jgi:ribosomal protein S18 acetylase RimI-like enzyme